MKEIRLNLVQFILIIFGVVVITALVVVQILKYCSNDIVKFDNNIVSDRIQTNDENIEDYFILYNGQEIELTTGCQVFDWGMPVNDENNIKYNTTYYNYNDGKYIGETKGEFLDDYGYSLVENVEKIAISKNYNICPRTYKNITIIPEELKKLQKEEYNIAIQSIDLDNDGKEEKIVCLTKKINGNDEKIAYSEITLYDYSYNKIANLVTIQDGFEADLSASGDINNAAFLSLDLVNYVDIDLDRNMEIIVECLSYEGNDLNIYKYENNHIEGPTDSKGYIGA